MVAAAKKSVWLAHSDDDKAHAFAIDMDESEWSEQDAHFRAQVALVHRLCLFRSRRAQPQS